MTRIIAFTFITCLFALTGCANLTPSSTQTPSIGTTDTNSASSKADNGLSLSLSLDSTTYQPGQEINIVVEEINALLKTNNVSSSDKWPLNGLSVSPCGTLNYPFGLAIFQGYYTSAEVSSITPLKLYNPDARYNCPMILSEINTYTFQPSTDVAAIFQISNPNPVVSTKMRAEIQAGGYWTGNASSTLTNFDPGLYTVVAGDEWGILVIVHFTVSNTSIITTATAVTTGATTQNQQPIEVITFLGPLLPINPGGPMVEMTLNNVATEPVISLTAVFTGLGSRDFNFDFAVTSANPLRSGTSISDKLTLIGAGFSTNVLYPLTIKGTLQNGITFSYTKLVEIVEPTY